MTLSPDDLRRSRVVRGRDQIEDLLRDRSVDERRLLVEQMDLTDATTRWWVSMVRPALGIAAIHHPALQGAALDQFVRSMLEHLRYDAESGPAVVDGLVALWAEGRLSQTVQDQILSMAGGQGLGLPHLGDQARLVCLRAKPDLSTAQLTEFIWRGSTHPEVLARVVRHPASGPSVWREMVAKCSASLLVPALFAHPEAFQSQHEKLIGATLPEQQKLKACGGTELGPWGEMLRVTEGDSQQREQILSGLIWADPDVTVWTIGRFIATPHCATRTELLSELLQSLEPEVRLQALCLSAQSTPLPTTPSRRR